MSQTIPATLPLNIIKPSQPYEATLLENVDLTPDSVDDVRHLVFDMGDSGLRAWEGQSVGIIPPGLDEAGKPYRLRLYSVASARMGDDGAMKTMSLCVKRTLYKKEDGSEYKGVASNFLNDLQPGQTAKICGPVGRHFLLPEDTREPILMFATGTGIAPFRGFLRYRATLPESQRGPAFLVFGVRTSSALLYHEELRSLLNGPEDGYCTAISSEQVNSKGGRMYVGDRCPELAEHLWPLLRDRKLYVYQCGLKGMEPGVEAGLAAIAEKHGEEWAPIRADLQAQKRWLIDTY